MFSFDYYINNFLILELYYLNTLKLTLQFHMISYNDGAMKVRDLDCTCKYHKNHIISDNAFSVNIFF